MNLEPALAAELQERLNDGYAVVREFESACVSGSIRVWRRNQEPWIEMLIVDGVVAAVSQDEDEWVWNGLHEGGYHTMRVELSDPEFIDKIVEFIIEVL